MNPARAFDKIYSDRLSKMWIIMAIVGALALGAIMNSIYNAVTLGKPISMPCGTCGSGCKCPKVIGSKTCGCPR